jgi:hypothetical protein
MFIKFVFYSLIPAYFILIADSAFLLLQERGCEDSDLQNRDRVR